MPTTGSIARSFAWHRPGVRNLDWLVGAFFQGHRSEALAADNNYNGDPLNPVLVSTDYDKDDKTQKQYALFGDLTYHYGDWQFEAGLRAEYYTSVLTAVNTNNVDPNTAPVLPIAPNSLSGHEFSPRVSVQYKFSPNANVYGTIARGFTPADEIEENFVVHPYRPEIATNYEVGLKSLLEHSVQLDAAIFYTTYNGSVVFVPTADGDQHHRPDHQRRPLDELRGGIRHLGTPAGGIQGERRIGCASRNLGQQYRISSIPLMVSKCRYSGTHCAICAGVYGEYDAGMEARFRRLRIWFACGGVVHRSILLGSSGRGLSAGLSFGEFVRLGRAPYLEGIGQRHQPDAIPNTTLISRPRPMSAHPSTLRASAGRDGSR